MHAQIVKQSQVSCYRAIVTKELTLGYLALLRHLSQCSKSSRAGFETHRKIIQVSQIEVVDLKFHNDLTPLNETSNCFSQFTHTHTHTRTHARTHAHTRTHNTHTTHTNAQAHLYSRWFTLDHIQYQFTATSQLPTVHAKN